MILTDELLEEIEVLRVLLIRVCFCELVDDVVEVSFDLRLELGGIFIKRVESLQNHEGHWLLFVRLGFPSDGLKKPANDCIRKLCF